MPQMPSPAPSATTRVCSASTALLKNDISFFPPLPSPSMGSLGPTEMKDVYIKSPPQNCMCTCSPGKDRKIAGTDDQSVPAMYSSNVGVRERMESFGEQDFLALFKARVVSLLF